MTGRPSARDSAVLVHFGDRLRNYREKAGLAQRELAGAIGLSRSSVANMEAGRQEPGIEILAALAAALNVTVDMLVCGNAEPAAPGPSQKANWRDLAGMLEAAAGQHRQLGETAWQEHRYHDAIRFRSIADGLLLALNQHHAISTGKPDLNHWSNWTTRKVPYTCEFPT